MPIDKYGIADVVKDSLGKILVAVGFLSFVIGVLNTSKMGSLVFAVGLFLGVCLMVIGLAINFELFKVKIRSREGTGTILMCIAPLIIVSGVIALFFAEYNWAGRYLMPTQRRGYIVKDGSILAIVIVPLARRYLWLFKPLIVAGAILFAVGVLLKLSDNF